MEYRNFLYAKMLIAQSSQFLFKKKKKTRVMQAERIMRIYKLIIF